LRVMVRKGRAEIYVNDHWICNVGVEDFLPKGDVGLLVDSGKARISKLEIYELEPLVLTEYKRDFKLTSLVALHAKDKLAQPIRTDIILANFEQGYGNWTVEGEAFNHPTTVVSGAKGFVGKCIANSYGEGSSVLAGTLASPQFTIERNFIRFLVCGRGCTDPR
jgi:hypothetical protein